MGVPNRAAVFNMRTDKTYICLNLNLTRGTAQVGSVCMQQYFITCRLEHLKMGACMLLTLLLVVLDQPRDNVSDFVGSTNECSLVKSM